MASLEELRQRLSEIDRELIDLIAARQRIVSEVGAHKIENAVPTRDYEREREVLKGARERARELGLDADVAEQVMQILIRTSLTQQERTRVAAGTSGAGKRVLVIGGAGKMGAWFAEFLASQGYGIELADPHASELPYPRLEDWRDSALDHEIIVVATPIKTAADVLTELAERRPRGLVMDIGSLKTPLRSALKRLAEAGCRVTSIHPMFGPDTQLLSGRHVIFVDLGVPEATSSARELFASTMAEQIEMSLEDHDRLIAFVLGLSHALNLTFFTALASSGELVPRLQRLSSTTFDAQLRVASLVARDNPHLYYDIQTLNEYGGDALDALTGAAARVRQLVENRDEAGFVELMEAGRRYMESRR
ncbi:MAG: prephenate dehydrogenase/arogenate dehydrogenase family protein [Gammaproteobacteria bacterium]|nr:prephenate dehydrogenase/arogenate dehydrogenase family protein [Gammaproteobacteria bacterium]